MLLTLNLCCQKSVDSCLSCKRSAHGLTHSKRDLNSAINTHSMVTEFFACVSFLRTTPTWTGINCHLNRNIVNFKWGIGCKPVKLILKMIIKKSWHKKTTLDEANNAENLCLFIAQTEVNITTLTQKNVTQCISKDGASHNLGQKSGETATESLLWPVILLTLWLMRFPAIPATWAPRL